jgi:hypothetical protein
MKQIEEFDAQQQQQQTKYFMSVSEELPSVIKAHPDGQVEEVVSVGKRGSYFFAMLTLKDLQDVYGFDIPIVPEDVAYTVLPDDYDSCKYSFKRAVGGNEYLMLNRRGTRVSALREGSTYSGLAGYRWVVEPNCEAVDRHIVFRKRNDMNHCKCLGNSPAGTSDVFWLSRGSKTYRCTATQTARDLMTDPEWSHYYFD